MAASANTRSNWHTLLYIQSPRKILIILQGWIQGSSSYANDEIVFPSYEIKKQAKRRFKRSLQVQSDNIFLSFND